MIKVYEVIGKLEYELYTIASDISCPDKHSKDRSSNRLLTDATYKMSNLYDAICREEFVVVKLVDKDFIFFMDGNSLYFSWVHDAVIHSIIEDEKITKITFTAKDVRFYYPAANAERVVYYLEDELGYEFAGVLNSEISSKIQHIKKYSMRSNLD